MGDDTHHAHPRIGCAQLTLLPRVPCVTRDAKTREVALAIRPVRLIRAATTSRHLVIDSSPRASCELSDSFSTRAEEGLCNDRSLRVPVRPTAKTLVWMLKTRCRDHRERSAGRKLASFLFLQPSSPPGPRATERAQSRQQSCTRCIRNSR